MEAHKILSLAEQHIGKGSMISSAEFCLHDAMAEYAAGKLDNAKAWALRSMRYSIGVFHPDYIMASE